MHSTQCVCNEEDADFKYYTCLILDLWWIINTGPHQRYKIRLLGIRAHALVENPLVNITSTFNLVKPYFVVRQP